jgi:hypothetical protein
VGEVVSKYEPELHPSGDGVWSITYKHQERQDDAQAALDELPDLDASTVLWVMDGDKAKAKVHVTRRDDELHYVIRIVPPRRITPDLAAINRDQDRIGDARIHHAGTAVVDPLLAPDDRELEVSTATGIVKIDRQKVLACIKNGTTTVALNDVRDIAH